MAAVMSPPPKTQTPSQTPTSASTPTPPSQTQTLTLTTLPSPSESSSSPSPSASPSSSPPAPHPALSNLPPIATAVATTTASPQRRPSSTRISSQPCSGSKPRPPSSSAQPGRSNSSKRMSHSNPDPNRLSTLSHASHVSRTSRRNSNSSPTRRSSSRTHSTVFPLFHSSLPYAIVRDFGYPSTHPLHYGPAPEFSELGTPASESNRRLSDPIASWDCMRSCPSAAPGGGDDFKLPNSSFAEDGDMVDAWSWKRGDGPPYSEDEDLQSPVISAHGVHRKQQSNVVAFDRNGRGRPTSRELATSAAGPGPPRSKTRKRKGRHRDAAAESKENNRLSRTTLPSRSFHQAEMYSSSDVDSDEPDDSGHTPIKTASPEQMAMPMNLGDAAESYVSSPQPDSDSDSATSSSAFASPGPHSGDAQQQPSRHSLTYTFSIASPDEECTGKAVSLYNFARENDNELPLAEGQIILVSYRLSQGWLVAQDPRTGESGLVPESYVRLFRDLEGWDGEEAGSAMEPEPGAAEPLLGDVEATQSSGTGVGLVEHVPAPSDAESAEQHGLTSSATPASLNQGAALHKPAVSSTFSTSRDDLEPRIDLIGKDALERRGSVDRKSGGDGAAGKAVSSTFSTSRDDLEPRRDLIGKEALGRRGSVDQKCSGDGAAGKAVSSTFSTSRDDLEIRRDLIGKEAQERRGSVDLKGGDGAEGKGM